MKARSRPTGTRAKNASNSHTAAPARPRDGAGVLDCAGAIEQGAHPGDLRARAPRPRARKKAGQSPTLRFGSRAQRVNDHERPLAFVEIAVTLLAVARGGFEIQEIVLDLKRGAEEEADADERIEGDPPAGPDEAPHPQGVDRGQPAGLLQHHLQIVFVGDVGAVLVPPTELERLAFGALPRDALGFLEDAQRERDADAMDVLLERLQAQEPHGIPRVDRERYAVQRVQRRVAPAACRCSSSMSSCTSSALCRNSIRHRRRSASSTAHPRPAPSRCRDSSAASCRRAADSPRAARTGTSGALPAADRRAGAAA